MPNNFDWEKLFMLKDLTLIKIIGILTVLLSFLSKIKSVIQIRLRKITVADQPLAFQLGFTLWLFCRIAF